MLDEITMKAIKTPVRVLPMCPAAQVRVKSSSAQHRQPTGMAASTTVRRYYTLSAIRVRGPECVQGALRDREFDPLRFGPNGCVQIFL